MRRAILAATVVALSLGGVAVAGAPPEPPPPSEVILYVVEPGDNWFSIAREFNTTVGALATANDTDWQTDLLHPGRVLFVVVPPPATTTTTTTTAPTSTTTTTQPPTSTTSSTSTTLPPSSNTFTDSFATLDAWSFAHWRNEIPGNASAASTASIAGGAAVIRAFDQNYGDATLRAAVPYNLTGGGTVTFDVSLDTGLNPLVGYPFVAFTDRPYNAPSIRMDNGQGPTPANGVYVQFRDNCRVPWGPPQVVSYANHAETIVEPNDQCAAAVAADGSARVELTYTGGVLTIRIDGQVIRSAAVTIPPVGWFMLGAHNHASDKYNPGQLSVDARFDNVTYPAGTSGRAFVVFNAYGRNATPAAVTVNGNSYPFAPHPSLSGSFAESVEINPADAVGTATVAGFNTVANVAIARGN